MPKTKFSDLPKFKQKDIIVKLKHSLDDFRADREYYLRQSPQHYHHLLVKTESEFVNPGAQEFFKRLHRIIIGNVLWKHKELEIFFTALERCGKHNPAEISRRLGTKSVSQVIMLIELFEHESNLAKACKAIRPVNYTDIPSAREMSDYWLEFEKIQVKMIQERINKIETKETFEENMQPISKWDEKKLELHTTDDILVNRSSIITLYHILQNWLQDIIKNLIALNDHYKRTYTQEKHEACSIISKYDVYKALEIYGYKFSKTRNTNVTNEDDDLIEISESQYMSSLVDKNIQEGYSSNAYSDGLSDEFNMQIDVQQTKNADQTLNETSEDSDNDEFDDTGYDSRYRRSEDVTNHQMIIDYDDEIEIKEQNVDKLYDNEIEIKEQNVDKLYEKAFLRLLINPIDAESMNISNEIENLEVLLDTGLRSCNRIFDEKSVDSELEDLLDSDKSPQHHNHI
ncbi:27537_t:CDS:2 [Dentiscutata erythropus]|uniref:27537_t:CDS:1 n=1 Tax=Dentiscutata erythropus TaxID=1348616 RepID=A0A9N9GCF6_9GLOM|nr:27537_t:CDS:2 [Dentiscutata erythropus]